MVELPKTLIDDPGADTVGTAGFILNMVAVIAFALCLAGLAMAGATLAISAGAVALVSFAGSLAILIADGRWFDDQDVAGASPSVAEAAIGAE